MNNKNKKKLDLGCGMSKKKGFIGVDSNPKTEADIIHNLNEFPYPFKSDSIDEIRCFHVLEHLPNLVKVMEELHRIGKPGCKISIESPYWSSYRAFKDPTHIRFFTEKTFDYFTEDYSCNFYTNARFEIIKKRLIFSSNKFVRFLSVFLPIDILKLFNNLISNIYFELEVVKRKKLPEVSVIILNWNNYSDSKECIDSLKNTTYPNLKIVVVDNGSTDGSYQKLKKEFSSCFFIQTGKNLGFSGGCNAGIRYALNNSTDYILLLNNDTIVKKDFLEPLVKTAEKEKDIGVVGGKGYYYDEPNILHMAGAEIDWLRATYKRYGANQKDCGQFQEIKEVGFTSAYFMLVKKEVFERVGLLSEQYFMGMEECDFGVRVRRAGYKIFFNPNSVIWHKVARSHAPAAPKNIYCTYRNKLIFMEKFLPFLFWNAWRSLFYFYTKYFAHFKILKLAKKYGQSFDKKVLDLVVERAFRDSKKKKKVSLKDLEEIENLTRRLL